MQIAHLRTLLAIRDRGSFSAAAEAVHLSHSAVSVQMRQLEEETGIALFVKGRRPASLTPLGEQFAEKARDIVARMDELEVLGRADSVTGRIAIGFVPTTLQTILPVVLAALPDLFPDLQVSVRSGLSADLAAAVEGQDLDFAFLTSPAVPAPAIRLDDIGAEPLWMIAGRDTEPPRRDGDFLRVAPYIAFSRKTWLGLQIDAELAERGLAIPAAIELDSIDAIENLVALGLGVSIVPQRVLAPPLSERMRCQPFGHPAAARRVVLASGRQSTRDTVRRTVLDLVRSRIASAGPAVDP